MERVSFFLKKNSAHFQQKQGENRERERDNPTAHDELRISYSLALPAVMKWCDRKQSPTFAVFFFRPLKIRSLEQ